MEKIDFNQTEVESSTWLLHGMVEDIGFRSTLIRMFDTAPMLVPNKDLSDVKVINHGEMVFRRISWTLEFNLFNHSRAASQNLWRNYRLLLTLPMILRES